MAKTVAPGAGVIFDLDVGTDTLTIDIPELENKVAIDDLASSEPGKGASLVKMRDGRWVEDAFADLQQFTPEAEGALGDGSTNDNAALAAMTAKVNAAGGGIINFLPKTYIIGAQQEVYDGETFTGFKPINPLYFQGLTKPIIINLNGCTFKCADGLKFGTFNEDGSPATVAWGATPQGASSPYAFMLMLYQCLGPIIINGGGAKFDGNINNQEIGGYWSEGYQIPMVGLGIYDSPAPFLRVGGFEAFGHGLDGMVVNQPCDDEAVPRQHGTFYNIICEDNVRQGCSKVGGKGYKWDNCKFNRTQRNTVITSPPGGGFDMEAEGRFNRDDEFVECEFSDNGGPGFVADSGDSADIRFRGCTFIGTTAYPVWPSGAGIVFDDCLIVGALVNPFGVGASRKDATKFNRCKFSMGADRSPTGQVFGTAMADIGQDNVRFTDCHFDTEGNMAATLPTAHTGVVFDECTFKQDGTTATSFYATFVGKNEITSNGTVTTDGSDLSRGSLFVNGVEAAGIIYPFGVRFTANDGSTWQTNAHIGSTYDIAAYEAEWGGAANIPDATVVFNNQVGSGQPFYYQYQNGARINGPIRP